LLNVGYNHFAANGFSSSSASSNTDGTNLETAKTKQQFDQITLTPAAARHLTLSRSNFRPMYQGQASGDTVGAGLTFSSDGILFTDAPAATGTPILGINNGGLLSVDLGNVPALRNFSNPVILRIYT